jgi:hypothetical protein
VRPRRRVVDAPVAGQLVGLLSVFPSALPVALAGDRAVTGVRPAHQAQRQGQVEVRLRGVGAVAVLLGAARGEDHRRLLGGQHVHGAAQVGRAHPGHPFHPVRPVRRGGGADRVEAGGAVPDVLLVD